MLLRRQLRNLNPRLPSPPSFASSSSSPPPRKGRQAVRRLLKLLSATPNSALSHALTTLTTAPETLSSTSAAALVSVAGDPLLCFDFYRFLRSHTPPFRPDAALFASLIRTQLLSISPHQHRIRYYLDEMRKHGISLSAAELRSLLAPLLPGNPELACSLLGHLIEFRGDALKVFDGLPQRGACADEPSAVKLKALIEAGEVGEAMWQLCGDGESRDPCNQLDR